ncbi:hypothetical protein [Streptomyces sp. LS1784]|uniref:hypothetical protein n=1 Tax=Streptomyces sp. LS1784 TaxID=2851533 RepID=UPI001CCDAE64|nr:hypothetical protein [Streptomyces sp. LS1784]
MILAAAALTLAAAAIAGWRIMSAEPELEGTWRNGSFLLELKGDGTIGGSLIPASVCDYSDRSPSDEVTEIDGSWKEEFFNDAGNGVRINAMRKDGQGKCNFWMSYLHYADSTELGFTYLRSPVETLVKSS